MTHVTSIRVIGRFAAVAALTFPVLTVDSSTSAAARAVLVSVGTGGQAANGDSAYPTVNAAGRYVAFESAATNLVAGDTNDRQDVFVRDLVAKRTTRVSVAGDGTQGNGHSRDPSISDSGRYVAFASGASNLVSGDTNGVFDVFVHDRTAGTTIRVSVTSSGTQGNAASYDARIAPGGKAVAFVSMATNLAPGTDTNGELDVFVRDLVTRRTERISSTAGGDAGSDRSGGPSLSANGSRVAFVSKADDLRAPQTNDDRTVYVYDRPAGTTWAVPLIEDPVLHLTGGIYADDLTPAISRDGKRLAFVNRFSFGSMFGAGTISVVAVSVPAMSVLVNVGVGESGEFRGDSTSAPRLPTTGTRVAFIDVLDVWNPETDTHAVVKTLSRSDDTTTVSCADAGCMLQAFDLTGAGTKAVVAAADDRWLASDTNGFVDILVVPA